jgi:hypothetical protein
MVDQFGLEMMRWVGDRAERPIVIDEVPAEPVRVL